MAIALVADGALEAKGWLHIHRPREFRHKRLRELLLDGDFVRLAPRDGDARVVVIDLGGAEGDVLEPVLGGEG